VVNRDGPLKAVSFDQTVLIVDRRRYWSWKLSCVFAEVLYQIDRRFGSYFEMCTLTEYDYLSVPSYRLNDVENYRD
jgi:hypothetical protein